MYKPIQYIDTTKIHPGMRYNECLPSASLASYVSCYWTVYSTTAVSNALLRVVPDGCIDIIYNLRDQASFIAGITDKTEYLAVDGLVSYLGIRFLPNSIPYILKYAARNSLNASFEITSEFKTLCEMTDTLLNEKRITRSIPIIETHLKAFFKNYTINNRFQVLLNHALDSNGTVSVHDLADYHDVSEKQIGRCFLDNIGISTKSFLRIIRFQNTFQSFQKQKRSTTFQAIDSGYYDQSHLIKDMNHFLGSMKNIY